MAAAVLLNGKGFDPQNLSIKLWLNGDLKQSSTTANMIFNVATIISELSKGFTLKPGDIILTGTPDGVGYPQQIALKSGDKMEIEIEKVGSLVNYIK
jgi:2-keto-4-pentenoate hydratase/2-oxohepta-3-ene-1,7-dioic acid hydratase in catechol pathway